MSHSILEIKAAIQLQKKPADVFEAIVEPSKMSNYFIAYGSARMEQDKQLTWRFPEFDMDIPIRVGKVEANKSIAYYWGSESGEDTLVTIILTPYKETDTIVTVTEKGMPNNEAGIKWLKGNTEGWANFLACLKAYLDHGINLRKGAFDFRFDKLSSQNPN